jgi:hypothetical protein
VQEKHKKFDQASIIDIGQYNKMKLNNLILSLIVNYAAAISVPENARDVGLEARYIGELCTAPIVCSLPPVVPRLCFFTISEGEKGRTK